ncbi:hypothetical protein D3C76_1482780 [compost metagenome]
MRQGHALGSRQRFERKAQLGIQRNWQSRTASVLHAWPWAVQRQFQYRLFTTQLPGPVTQLACLLTGFHALALPGGEIGILNAQLWQLDALIELHQLIDQYRHRLPVSNDVVQRHHE